MRVVDLEDAGPGPGLVLQVLYLLGTFSDFGLSIGVLHMQLREYHIWMDC